MKKAVVVLAAALLILSLGAASLAAPVAPKGITATALTDFTALEDGEKTYADLGFWGVDANQKVTVSNGLVTIPTGAWGAFPSFNEEQMNVLKSADGLGFYVETEAQAVICCGFNADTGTNHILAENKTALLVDKAGKVTSVTTFYLEATSQSAITIPANFKGYLYFPYDNFISNDADAAVFDTANMTVQTLIFSVGSEGSCSYGEIYAFSGKYTPGEDGEKDPSGNEGDLSMAAYAVAAFAGLGGVAFARKRK